MKRKARDVAKRGLGRFTHREVVFPKPPRSLVPPEIVCRELDLANHKLFRIGVDSRCVDSDAVVLQHVEERGLPRIVEPKKEDLGALVMKTCRRKRNKKQCEVIQAPPKRVWAIRVAHQYSLMLAAPVCQHFREK